MISERPVCDSERGGDADGERWKENGGAPCCGPPSYSVSTDPKYRSQWTPGDVGGRDIIILEPDWLAGRALTNLPGPSVVEPAVALSLPSLLVQTGRLPHFPKVGSVFVPVWNCGCRGAKTSREAPQDRCQLPS